MCASAVAAIPLETKTASSAPSSAAYFFATAIWVGVLPSPA